MKIYDTQAFMGHAALTVDGSSLLDVQRMVNEYSDARSADASCKASSPSWPVSARGKRFRRGADPDSIALGPKGSRFSARRWPVDWRPPAAAGVAPVTRTSFVGVLPDDSPAHFLRCRFKWHRQRLRRAPSKRAAMATRRVVPKTRSCMRW